MNAFVRVELPRSVGSSPTEFRNIIGLNDMHCSRARSSLVAALALTVLLVEEAPSTAAADRLQVAQWRYTTSRPADAWTAPEFDDSQWRQGPGGFGEPSTPGSRVETTWKTEDIWLRRRVELKSIPRNVALLIHHDEDVEVSLNGSQVLAKQGYVTEYQVVPLTDEARGRLRIGANLLAVHCRQTGGGQYIDVHLVDADDVPRLPPRESFRSDMITRWGRQVTAENAWTEYPRPQLVRPQWRNLNGHWNYAVTPADRETPSQWTGKILVPFCIESKLSGVGQLLEPDEALWYRRGVELTPKSDRRLLLHFEAVDYRCEARLNGQLVGSHVGGNLPFTFDVTDAARPGDNELTVKVQDATGGAQLRGKQRLNPGGIWYTRVSGIWQTVWLEEVPRRYIDHLKISGDVDSGEVSIEVRCEGTPLEGETLSASIVDGDRRVARAEGELRMRIDDPILWSPENPHLYDLEVVLTGAGGEVVDRVRSYTGLRKVGRTRDEQGVPRLTLNGQEIFHWGPLDQGWWPDGLLTPPSDEGMRYDIEFLKAAGFNMIRKHIKVEPRRFYYHCDRLGMMVWQDQVSGGENPRWTRMAPNPRDARWSDADHRQFMTEFKQMVDSLDHFPSVVVWTPFNEAWGQHRTMDVGRWISRYDPTRLVNVASGGNFWPVGDIADHHNYPHPSFPLDDSRFDQYVKVVGEFGGHGWPVKDHLWNPGRDNWGYGGLPQSLAELKDRYRTSIELLAELKRQGIAAGVYTQTTDVEEEINGLLTYDREVVKIPAEELRKIHEALRK